MAKERVQVISRNFVHARARYYIALKLSALGFLLVLIVATAFGQSTDTNQTQTTAPAAHVPTAAELRIEDVKSVIQSGNPQGAAELASRYDAEPEPTVRAWLVRGAAALNSTQSISLFEAALDDSSPWVRLAAVECLGRLGGSQVIADLEAALARESSSGVRQHIAFSLGVLKKSSSAAALSDALAQDEDPHVRLEAAHALKRVGTSDAKNALKNAKSDPDPRVRKIANEP